MKKILDLTGVQKLSKETQKVRKKPALASVLSEELTKYLERISLCLLNLKTSSSQTSK